MAKIKAVVPGGGSDESKGLSRVFGGAPFAREVLDLVVGGCLGVEDPLNRPAEYYVQVPDETVYAGGKFGVVVTMSGVSRDGRTPKQFHAALMKLVDIATAYIRTALTNCKSTSRVQLFCVIQIDGQIELVPGKGAYGNQLESEAIWISTQTG